MSRKRCRRQVRPLTNPLIAARDHATRLTAEEVARAITPAQAAFALMRQGRASSEDWAFLVGALGMAWSIEKQGVVRGLAEHLATADAALAAIEQRASAHTPPGGDAAQHWRAPTLYGHEIEAIGLLLELHQFQLEQLSYGEFRRALAQAIDRARSRKGGQRVQVV